MLSAAAITADRQQTGSKQAAGRQQTGSKQAANRQQTLPLKVQALAAHEVHMERKTG